MGITNYQSDEEGEEYSKSYFGHNTGHVTTAATTSTSFPTTQTSGGATTASNSGPRSFQNCCLIDDGKMCHRSAGNASYSKRIQKNVYYKKLRLEADHQASHIYICDYHKSVIQNARTRIKRDSEDEMNEADESPELDLFQLQVNTLRRYKKHFKISTKPGLNKAQLSEVLTRHFRTIPINEKEVLTYFIYTVKAGRNKLDNSSRPDGGNGSTSNTDYYDRY